MKTNRHSFYHNAGGILITIMGLLLMFWAQELPPGSFTIGATAVGIGLYLSIQMIVNSKIRLTSDEISNLKDEISNLKDEVSHLKKGTE